MKAVTRTMGHVKICQCLRCPKHHKWISRKTDGTLPAQCPHCKSRLWNVPRKRK